MLRSWSYILYHLVLVYCYYKFIVEQFEANFQVKDMDLDDFEVAPKIFWKTIKIKKGLKRQLIYYPFL